MSNSADTAVTQSPLMSVVRVMDVPLTASKDDPFSSSSEVWVAPDGSKKVGIYRILPGAKFDFEQRYHEALYVLQGNAIFQLEDGSTFHLRAGDLAQMMPGAKLRVEVSETFHGFFVMTSASGPVEM